MILILLYYIYKFCEINYLSLSLFPLLLVAGNACTKSAETSPGYPLAAVTMYSLYSHEPVNKRLMSRNGLVHFVTPLDKTIQPKD